MNMPDYWDGPRPEKNKDRISEIYGQCGLRQILETPRDIKRIFNRVEVHANALMGEVHIADLLGLEALAIKALTVYEHIRRNPSAYTGIGTPIITLESQEQTVIEMYKEERESAFNEVRADLKRSVTKLLSFLFPRLKTNGFHREQADYREMGQVASNDVLSIALTFGLPRNEISRSLLDQFFVMPESRKEIINELDTESIVSNFIDRLNERVQQSAQIKEPEDFITALGSLAERPIVWTLNENIDGDIFKGASIRRIGRILRNFLEKFEPDERSSLWKVLFDKKDYLTLATEALTEQLKQHGKHGAKGYEGEPFISDSNLVDQMEKRWKGFVVASIKNETIQKSNARETALSLLRRIDPELTQKLGIDPGS